MSRFTVLTILVKEDIQLEVAKWARKSFSPSRCMHVRSWEEAERLLNTLVIDLVFTDFHSVPDAPNLLSKASQDTLLWGFAGNPDIQSSGTKTLVFQRQDLNGQLKTAFKELKKAGKLPLDGVRMEKVGSSGGSAEFDRYERLMGN